MQNAPRLGALIAARRTVWYAGRAVMLVSVVLSFVVLGGAPGGEGGALVLLLGVPVVVLLCARAAFARRPRLVLLLRPFGEAEVTGPLTRLVRRELAFVGITFTLADAHVRPATRGRQALGFLLRSGGNLTAWLVPMRLGAQTRAGVDELAAGLRSPTRLAWLWLLTGSRIEVIPAADAHWQDAVRLLLAAADVVVVDASETGPGAVWEFQLLRRTVLTSALVFVAAEDRVTGARQMVRSFFPGHAARVFAYRADGSLARRDDFLAAVDEQSATLAASVWARA